MHHSSSQGFSEVACLRQRPLVPRLYRSWPSTKTRDITLKSRIQLSLVMLVELLTLTHFWGQSPLLRNLKIWRSQSSPWLSWQLTRVTHH
ncbi:hypothetical protein DPMN_104296 [Dreissena polymorpha]|uniref:Uncharacterized protein n=1 Tax=Dreissena polymorpha TaxID=45954 RepID=A0A9D4K110_DREPO|nr:hypothetical protein DPMN_104231 [Dreissena polymorpha]KAH3831036.1 hypothetical protein DPMN_104296 [Dreissena polymorpha]